MPFSAVLFDLDGTLTDSAPGLFASLRHMHAALGLPAPTDAELLPWLGPPIGTTLRDAGHDDATVEAGLAAFREHLEAEGLSDQRVYDGIPRLLDDLALAGVPTGIATFKPQGDADRVADEQGFRAMVGTVHGRIGDEGGHSKAPVIARALDVLGLAPSATIAMVGDRHHDIASAIELGLTPIGVAYGYGGDAELRSAGAVHVVDSVGALRALLLDGERAAE